MPDRLVELLAALIADDAVVIDSDVAAAMADVRFSARAYCKIMLHAAKYPHCAINGVLLGRRGEGADGLQIVDAVPLFHVCLQVSPMAEVALTQVDQMASAQNLTIVGYYMANENISDHSTDKASHRIAEKIVENFPSACLVVVDNKRLTLFMESPAVLVSQFVDGKWRSKDINSIHLDQDILEATATLLDRRSFQSLVDFDNHLDDISQDWRNEELNNEIEKVAGGL